MKLRFLAFGAAILASSLSSVARAQVHWDVGAQVGATKRFVSSRPPGVGDAGVGPSAEIHGHLAVLPLLRVGGYLAHDISPSDFEAARRITALGLRAKLTPPWPRDALRAWLFTGIGFAAAYSSSFTRDTPAGTVDTSSAWGFFAEVPVGIGLAYRLRKPIELYAEAAARIGFAHGGALYSGRDARLGNGQALILAPLGYDSLALSLSLGIQFEM